MAQNFPDNLPPAWKGLLEAEASENYFKELSKFLRSEYRAGKKIFPQQERILRALQLVDYPSVKIVILGQDPYHGDDQAVGLSFAVPNQLSPKPPSLVNIFKEMQTDLKFNWNKSDSELTGWAQQGVLLLNTVLTVRRKQAFSHQKRGWEEFTNRIIQRLNDREKGMVFILWGAAAQKKKELITGRQHFIIKSPHPSPLSAFRGFFGSRAFSRANDILKNKLGLEPIDWSKINA